ncbi:hypothetical protein LIER_03905 [Lithospermum erythrorhizon]|uniref:Uncharacterized protein n=1 Tax=Lithospermum erythrorhizon TaxID=34254 RepID=A0AAV3NUW4_LITER
MRHQRGEDSQTKLLSELSSLVLNMIRSPVEFSDKVVAAPPVEVVSRRRKRGQQITPLGFAYFMLGISLALMLCGSLTFFIGFLLMPWVLAFAMVLYVVGVICSLSLFGRAMLCCCSYPSSPSKECSSWKLL